MKVWRRWKNVGEWKRKKRSWDDELSGLYEYTFCITTYGGSGLVWEVREKGNKIYYTVSDGGVGRSGYNVYTHYVLNNKGIQRLREIGILKDGGETKKI
jgi:hypothetical protein